MPVADAVAQREASLATANRRRLAQARLRRELRALTPDQGAALAADVLLNQHDQDLQAMPVFALVGSIRRVGTKRALSLINDVGIVRTAATARIRDLTPRQRDALAERISAYREARVA